MKKNFEIDMCEGPILGKMLRFALPLMASSMLQLLFNAADVIVVGRFAGDNALAAVGSNGALINLLTNLFIGLSVGANVLVARYYGAGKREELRDTIDTAMLVSLISGFLLMGVGVVWAKQFLKLMQTPGKVLDLATLYLKIYFIGMPAMMIYNFGSAILRAVGDTQRPLYFLLLAGIINVILNLILVIVFHLGVAGVAIATVISQVVSATLVVICMIRDRGAVHFNPKHMRIVKDKFKDILRIGLPAGFQGTLFSLSNVVIQSAVNGFGEVVVAGNSAAANIEGFVYMAMNAFHHATLNFAGQNMGAGKIERVKKSLFTGLLCVTVTGLVFGQAVVLFGTPLLHIYTDTDAAVEAGMVRLQFVCGTYFLCGIMDVMVGAIRGLGYAIMPMIVSLVGACGLRLLYLATIFTKPQFHKISVVYATYPISWIITIAAHVICFAIVYRKIKRRMLDYGE